MLHKWEAMTGLPENSLAYEEGVRKEMVHYFCSKESTNKRDTPKEVFEGYAYKEIWKDGGN